jgi:hypothetical protein
MRDVRLTPSPAVLLDYVTLQAFPRPPGSRAWKLPGRVNGVYDYAGPSRNSRYIAPDRVAFHQCKSVGVLIASFRSSIPSPSVPLFTLHHDTSQRPAQNSGPSGSLLLSRRTLSFPASCRFIPAHCIGDLASVQLEDRRNFSRRSASELACFILKSDAAHQFGETRVATKRIERRLDF